MRTSFRNIFILILCLKALFEIKSHKEEDDKVIKIKDPSSLDTLLTQHNVVLVNFFAPWCGHCIALEKELTIASNLLHSSAPSIKIVSIDATNKSHAEFFTQMGVNGYPTLIIYKSGKRYSNYLGSRKHKDIVDYLSMKSGPSIIIVNALADLQKYIDRIDKHGIFGTGIIAVALGAFVSENNKAASLLLSSASNIYDQIIFLRTFSDEMIRIFGVTDDTILVFSSEDKEIESNVDFYNHYKRLSFDEVNQAEDLVKIILQYSIPLVTNYSENIQPFLRLMPIRVHVLILTDHENSHENSLLLSSVKAVSRDYAGRLFFIHVTSNYFQIMAMFDVDLQQLPQIIIADMTEPSNIRRFDFDDFIMKKDTKGQEKSVVDEENEESVSRFESFSEENLRMFFSDYERSLLRQRFKSEDDNNMAESPHLTSNVYFSKVLTGNNFIDTVMQDDNMSYLVYVYASWCGHCKSFEPVMAQVALHFKDSADISVRRIDGIKNDIPHDLVKVRAFPTILLFPACAKQWPVEYVGARSLAAIITFVEAISHSSDGSGVCRASASHVKDE